MAEMTKQQAIKIAIEAIEEKRRRKFAVGHNALKSGLDFEFAKKDEKGYSRLTEAIETLKSMDFMVQERLFK